MNNAVIPEREREKNTAKRMNNAVIPERERNREPRGGILTVIQRYKCIDSLPEIITGVTDKDEVDGFWRSCVFL